MKKGIAVLLLLICLAGCALAETDEQLWQAYQQPNVRTEGQAFVEIIPSAEQAGIIVGDPSVWRFSLFMTEKNGVAFTADEIAFTRFDEEHNVIAHVIYEGAEYAASYAPAQYLPGETMSISVGQPVDSSAGYGIRISGTDVNGNACSFHVYVPLLHEELPVESPDSFRASAEGAQLVALIPSDDPVYLEPHEFFGGGLGWSSSVMLTNISDAPVEVTDMCMVIFREDDSSLVQQNFSGRAIALVSGMEDNILGPGVSAVYSDICPYQDVKGYGYRFTVKAQDGRTQTANCYYSCAKEEKAE